MSGVTGFKGYSRSVLAISFRIFWMIPVFDKPLSYLNRNRRRYQSYCPIDRKREQAFTGPALPAPPHGVAGACSALPPTTDARDSPNRLPVISSDNGPPQLRVKPAPMSKKCAIVSLSRFDC